MQTLSHQIAQQTAHQFSLSFPELRWAVFNSWTLHRCQEFQNLERTAFRQDLQYTLEDIHHLSSHPNFEVLFIYSPNLEAALILHGEEKPSILWLDTIIVSAQLKGLGRILLKSLITNSPTFGWKELHLNTEYFNEHGFALVQYYQQLGFVIQDVDDNGNVHMAQRL